MLDAFTNGSSWNSQRSWSSWSSCESNWPNPLLSICFPSPKPRNSAPLWQDVQSSLCITSHQKVGDSGQNSKETYWFHLMVQNWGSNGTAFFFWVVFSICELTLGRSNQSASNGRLQDPTRRKSSSAPWPSNQSCWPQSAVDQQKLLWVPWPSIPSLLWSNAVVGFPNDVQLAFEFS